MKWHTGIPALGIALVLVVPRSALPQTSAAPAADKSANGTPAHRKLAKIVIVSKRDACQCTRKAIDASLAALKQALGPAATLPVEQLMVETDLAKIEPVRSQEPFFTFPAIYFLDFNGRVVRLLQGELTAAQITAVLEATRS